MGKNQLCTIAAFNKESEEAAHNIVMQIAAMNPIAIDEAGVPESVKEKEIQVAIEKTKAEQVQKAVEAALKKAGICLLDTSRKHVHVFGKRRTCFLKDIMR